MGTTRSFTAGAATLLVVGALAAGSVTACTASDTPPPAPPAPAPLRPGPTVPDVAGLPNRIEAFLGASRWGRYDRVTALLVVLDGRTVVERRRADLPEQRREVSGVTAAVLVALTGILLDRSASGAGPPYLGTEGLAGVRRPLNELLPAPLPPGLAGTSLHDLLVGTSADPTDQLAEVLTAATGRPVPDLARELLFGPLGMDPPWTAAGPELTAAEIAALAALWLDRGAAGGRQVVPAAWMDASTRPYAATGRRRLPYAGYRQWVARADGSAATVLTGRDGQLVEIVPGKDLVVVVVCDAAPQTTFPAESEAFVELVSSTVVPAVG